MTLECYACEKLFDIGEKPPVCPLCGSSEGFREIRIYDKNDKVISFAEHIAHLRSYYLKHTPQGISKDKIRNMDANELFDMSYIWDEL